MAESEKISFDGIGVAEGSKDEIFGVDEAVRAALFRLLREEPK